jgi:hypothetical protein
VGIAHPSQLLSRWIDNKELSPAISKFWNNCVESDRSFIAELTIKNLTLKLLQKTSNHIL